MDLEEEREVFRYFYRKNYKNLYKVFSNINIDKQGFNFNKYLEGIHFKGNKNKIRPKNALELLINLDNPNKKYGFQPEYKAEFEKFIKQCRKYKVSHLSSNINLKLIIAKLEFSFKNDSVKKEVLSKELYKKNVYSKIDSTGFNYTCAEVLYFLDGGKKKWKKETISKDKWGYGSHTYLVNKKTEMIYDITADQYTKLGIKIPYNLGIAGGFKTNELSKASKKLAELSGLIDIEDEEDLYISF